MQAITKSRLQSPRIVAVLCLAGLTAIVLLVVAAPSQFMHDEAWYLNEVGFIHKHGFGSDFFRAWFGSAGPLVGWTHWLFEPLTRLHLPGVRLVNTLFTAASMLVLWVIFKNNKTASPWPIAAGFLAMPPIWKVSGIVYTEMPAIFLVCLTLWILATGQQSTGMASRATLAKQIAFGFAAGLVFSLAILGRQMLAPIPLIALIAALFYRAERALLLAFFTAAIPFPLWVFSLWGGLQPSTINNASLEPSQVFEFTCFAGAYSAVLLGILIPQIFKLPLFGYLTVGALGLIVALLLPDFHTLPLTSILKKTGMAELGLLHLVIQAGVISLCLTFVIGALRLWWSNIGDGLSFTIASSALALCAAPGIIGPAFGSRYLVPAIPFLLLASRKWIQASPWLTIRMTAGMTLGAISLWGHLFSKDQFPYYHRDLEVFYPHLWEPCVPLSPKYWDKFDYGNSPFIQNPRWSAPVTKPVEF